MPYHVRITKKSKSWGDSLELDLTKKELENNIVRLYHRGKKFHCNGEVIDPHDIERIKINYTERSSNYYLPIIQSRRRESRAIALTISDEWYVTEEGDDVTRQFINKTPKKNSLRIISNFKEFLPKNKLKLLALIPIVVAILTIPSLVGFNIDFSQPSNLDAGISGRDVKEFNLEYPSLPTLEVINLDVVDSPFTGPQLWLTNNGKKYSIYTKTISVHSSNFATSFIDEEQIEIKPGETVTIPLQFYPDSRYWDIIDSEEIITTSMVANIKIGYTSKNKDFVYNNEQQVEVKFSNKSLL